MKWISCFGNRVSETMKVMKYDVQKVDPDAQEDGRVMAVTSWMGEPVAKQ
jgi:hypothetical protein